MPKTARHTLLREATAVAHASLECVIGDLADLAGYGHYVAGLYRFRQPLEERLREIDWPDSFDGWRPVLLTADLEQDLEDLALDIPFHSAPAPPAADRSTLMGMLYVLEGSRLGAAIVRQRAHRLGLRDDCGARHLTHQINARASWPAFLSLLDRLPDIDDGHLANSANETFSLARSAMVDERRSAA